MPTLLLSQKFAYAGILSAAFGRIFSW